MPILNPLGGAFSLDDEGLRALQTTAASLPQHARGQFLAAVARQLKPYGEELGAGLVARTARAVATRIRDGRAAAERAEAKLA